VARLLPPESSAINLVSREVGISVAALQRWRANALANASAAGSRRLSAAARLQALIVRAAMDEATRSARCREQGLHPSELDAWKRDVIAGLGEPPAASAAEALQERWRVHETALSETAALRELQKTLGGLPRRRGRITRLEDRQILVRDIEQACADGSDCEPQTI
jgi:hypothetical protein